MAKNIRKNKRLTKRRMNSSKKRLTKKRLTKRRMNLSKRKSRIKVSKKRLTKKRLTTKRGGTVLLPDMVITHGFANKARRDVASAEEAARLKLQIEPYYTSWNEKLLEFKKLPPPPSQLYYSALQEEITNMRSTTWYYGNLQPQSKVKYIEYLIEYIKRTIQEKGSRGITRAEHDEYWTHMTVDASGNNVLNSSVLGWPVILGEAFGAPPTSQFPRPLHICSLPPLAAASPNCRSFKASTKCKGVPNTRSIFE